MSWWRVSVDADWGHVGLTTLGHPPGHTSHPARDKSKRLRAELRKPRRAAERSDQLRTGSAGWPPVLGRLSGAGASCGASLG